MNTKTFLGNAVLQNFTLANFRLERGRVWRNGVEASDDAPRAAKEREKALKEAKKDWKDLDVQLGKKIEGFSSLSKYPWKNIDPKVVDEIRDISRGPSSGPKDVGPLRFNMEELWYDMLDGKLEIKEIAARSPVLQEMSPSEITALAKDPTSRLGRLLTVIPMVVRPFFEAYLARPKGFKIDAIPVLENNVTAAYSVPVVIGAGGKQLLYDIEAPVSGGVVQAPKYAKLKDGGQKIELVDVQGSFLTERMSFVVNGERYDVEFQNGHVASANVAKLQEAGASTAEARAEKVKVGKTFDMGEITNEWGQYDGVKIALEKDLEKAFTEGRDGKRYDAKSVLQALNAYAASTGRERDMTRQEGKRRTGGLLGFFRGKKEEVITIAPDSIAKVEAGQQEDFRTWLEKYSTQPEGKKDRARFDATNLYRDQYKALKSGDPGVVDKRTLLVTKMLIDTNGDGLFPTDAQIRGRGVDAMIDRSAYTTRPNRERNAVVDLMIWDQEFKRGGFMASEAFKKLNQILALGQAGVPDANKLKITNYDEFMNADAATIQRFREAYVNGRERAAAMSGNNLAEYLQGGAVEMSEVSEKESKAKVDNMLKELKTKYNFSETELNKLSAPLYVIEGAFYMHWRRDEFKKYVGNQLKEHRVEHSIDGAGGAGRIRIPLAGKNEKDPSHLAVIIDFGGGKPQSGEGAIAGVSAGLEYSIQKGKDEYRVIAGTGVISGGWSRRTESGKEYGVNAMASYFGSLLAVVGHYNWDGLKGKLDKRVIASVENSGLNTIIDGLRSGGNMKGAFAKMAEGFGEENQLHADLMAPILAQFGVDSAAKIPADKQETAALMYTKMVATMVTQIEGQEASWMKDHTKFGLAGIQAGFALVAGIPAPVFGIILRHGVETFEGVKSPTSDAIRRVEEAAQRRIDKDKGLIGSEAEVAKRGNVTEYKASKKVGIADTKLEETENGLKIKEERIEGEVDLWSEMSTLRDKVDEKEWDPYLDSKIGGKMNAKLNPNGFRVKGLEKGTKDRYLSIDVKGIEDPLKRYGARQTITVLADSGADVRVSPDGTKILAGGTVANISAKTRLWAGGKDTTIRISGVRGESSHAYGKDTPRIEMVWNAEEGRAANIEPKNSTERLKVGDSGVEALPDVRQVQEAIKVQEGMRAYEKGVDGRIGELMRVDALQESSANVVRNASTLERYLAPTMKEIEKQVKDKKKDEGLLEKACFQAFVEGDQNAKDQLVDLVTKESKPARAAKGVAEVALSTPINDAERTYIINRLVDAYFVDRPNDKSKDLKAAIAKRVETDKANAVKALADDLKKVLGTAPSGVDWEKLSAKLHDIVYEEDITGQSFADRVTKVDGTDKKAKTSYGEGNVAKGDMLLSVTAHRSKGQTTERFGMAGFVGAEGARVLSLTDVKQFANVSQDEVKLLEQYMRVKTNGLTDVVGLRQVDISNKARQADLLRLPIVQQLRVAFPVLLGADKTEGLAKAMDAALKGMDVDASKVDFTAIRDIVADLIEGKAVTRTVGTGVMSHSLETKGDDKEIMATVTLTPQSGTLKVGAYNDCTNFSLTGKNGYDLNVKLEGVGVDRWDVPAGPGQASSYSAIEQTALGSIVKGRYSKWSILLAKCVEETTSWSRVGFGQPIKG